MVSRGLWLRWVLLGFLLSGVLEAENILVASRPEVLAAMKRFAIAPGLQIAPWAVEPLVRDITSVSFDGQGRAYVVETGRRRTSVFDIRNLEPWLEEDFALRTTGDRSTFLGQVLDPQNPSYLTFLSAVTKSEKSGFQDLNRDGQIDWRDLEVESERVCLVTDTNRDGVAETSRTFVDGFNSRISGVAAGVLAEGTNIWFACIPDLWRFDADNFRFATGAHVAFSKLIAEKDTHRRVSGFGVHIAFGGHDLHGLIKGPDGRIYFTIADRGSSATNRFGSGFQLPDCGAVFRCEPDGSDLEVFARGLRNPMELAFDSTGMLWTADNNGDGGDKARWTLVLQGADYGWSIGWQWLSKMGAWNSERLWHTQASNSAAYILPPVAHIGHGPAGLAYYPGTGLGERYRDHFFYADFPGGIRTFRVEPDGAFFKVVQSDEVGRTWMEDNSLGNRVGKLLWGLSPVDVTFPPFGGVIVADWVEGWDKTGKGRLWHITDPALAQDSRIGEVSRVLGQGMAGRHKRELGLFLGHVDMRIRLEAQWELARRGTESLTELRRVARDKKSVSRARVHALWALGQIVRQSKGRDSERHLASLTALFRDPDPEIRSQTALLMAAGCSETSRGQISTLLIDPVVRVRFAAAMGLAEDSLAESSGFSKASLSSEVSVLKRHLVGRNSDLPALMRWLLTADGSGADPALRHAGVRALSGVLEREESAFQSLINHPSDSVRLSTLLAVRSRLIARSIEKGNENLMNPRLRAAWIVGLQGCLEDTSPQIVLEAARVIHDLPVPEAFPKLVKLLDARESLRLERKGEWPLGLPFTYDEWRAWILRRAVNAAFRSGEESDTLALAGAAVRNSVPESVRVEALEALEDWGTAQKRDRVVGLYRPSLAHSKTAARKALESVWLQLLQ